MLSCHGGFNTLPREVINLFGQLDGSRKLSTNDWLERSSSHEEELLISKAGEDQRKRDLKAEDKLESADHY